VSRVQARVDDLLRGGGPDRPALTHGDRTLRYGELTAEVDAASAGLRALGLHRGDRVAVFAEKRVETVVAMFAVFAAGGVLVPVNPLLKPDQVGHVLADCGATALVTTAPRYRALTAVLAKVREVVLLGDPRDPGEPEGHRVTPWESFAGPGAVPEPVVDDDVAAILYTSGSTGGPKGVVLTHRNLLAGAHSVASYLGHTEDDVVLAVLPFSFDAGLSQLTTSFAAGAHVVLVNYVRPREVVRLCARHGVTGLTCVPPLWSQLAAADWPSASTTALRYFANTGGRLPRPLLATLRATFPSARPFLMYGLTEAFRSTYLDPAEVGRRPDSIGKAVPNAEVLVVREDGTVCDPHEEGEIVHRGAFVALGYWNDPERTALRFRPYPPEPGPEGPRPAVWTGDRAYRDFDGFLYFTGRTDEMIKTSGYRVSPAEIEDAAYATGAVAEAVAFGMPDETLGQHIVLAVTGRDGDPLHPDALRDALRGSLPGYMVPRTVLVRTGLPRSGNGKFDVGALRAAVTS
jgi:acyl-CoA ligase (AMP-forming) (exosortase A-associated)